MTGGAEPEASLGFAAPFRRYSHLGFLELICGGHCWPVCHLLQRESWIFQLRLGCLVWFSFYCCPLIKQRMMNCWCQRCSLQMGTSWFIIIIIRHMKRIRRTRLMELRTDQSLGCEASNSCNRGARCKLGLIWWATTAQLWPKNPELLWWHPPPFSTRHVKQKISYCHVQNRWLAEGWLLEETQREVSTENKEANWIHVEMESHLISCLGVFLPMSMFESHLSVVPKQQPQGRSFLSLWRWGGCASEGCVGQSHENVMPLMGKRHEIHLSTASSRSEMVWGRGRSGTGLKPGHTKWKIS